MLERAPPPADEVGQEGDSARGRFVYFLNEGHPGTVIEMADMTPARRRIFDKVREAAIGWDGEPTGAPQLAEPGLARSVIRRPRLRPRPGR